MINKDLKPFCNEGKTAFITGGAGFLGIRHAEALVEIGTQVVIGDINEKLLDKASIYFQGEKVLIEKVDVTSSKELKKFANNLENKNINIDILINNAAINPKVISGENSFENKSRLEDYDENLWDLELNIGLKSAFLCSKLFGAKMASRNFPGVILNIASDLSIISPMQSIYKIDGISEDMQPVKPITYSVIKSALIGMTKYLATYWCDKGIRCNAISPGGVYDSQSELFLEKLSKLIPLGRMANSNEYKSAIQFLCSDASSYMTGHNLVIDGGRSVW